MDIDILLMLQNFRAVIQDALTPFMEKISFSSGHSVTAATLYGGMAVCARKMMRWISVLCVILILLTGFSRNYLGVHTPQDVLVGLTEGALMLWGVSAVFKYIANHPEKENQILAAES